MADTEVYLCCCGCLEPLHLFPNDVGIAASLHQGIILLLIRISVCVLMIWFLLGLFFIVCVLGIINKILYEACVDFL